MNYTENDNGELVITIGSPGSKERKKSKRGGRDTYGGNEEWKSLDKRKARSMEDTSGTWEKENIPQPKMADEPLSAQQANSFFIKKKTNREEKVKIVLDILRKSLSPMYAIDIAKESKLIGASSWIYVVCRDMLRDGLIKKNGTRYELS